MCRTKFSIRGKADYLFWIKHDKAILRRIDRLIANVLLHPFEGIGKPEPLKNPKGYWSRRITEEHRLVYRVSGTGGEQQVEIIYCRGHYE
jgi:toxin YoeB